MGVLTDIVLAKTSETQTVLADFAGAPKAPWPHRDVKGLGSLELADLYAVLLNNAEADVIDLSEEFDLACEATGDEGPWLMHVPARFTALLAAMVPASIPGVVAQWLAADEPPDWDAAELAALLPPLSILAQQAQASAASADPLQLFLWISL